MRPTLSALARSRCARIQVKTYAFSSILGGIRYRFIVARVRFSAVKNGIVRDRDLREEGRRKARKSFVLAVKHRSR